ncbi:MAG: chloride channel protein [Actinomycetota bacterium]|nr:chloride channel protein [Actinomycetota bacterium]
MAAKRDITALLKRFDLSGQTPLLIQAVVIGLLAGGLDVAFRSTLNYVHNVIFLGGWALLGIEKGGWRMLLIPLLPMAGAVLLIPLSLKFGKDVNGYGFPGFLEAVNVHNAKLKLRNLFLKIIAPALTIGSGGSAGVEGPVAILGGTAGSAIGRIFGASRERMRLLVAAGSAGAIAATFNAPIAGVMFANEIVLVGNYEVSSFAATIIASGLATAVSRAVYGTHPAFAIAQLDIARPVWVSFAEIPLYANLGAIAGVLAVVYIRVFHGARSAFDRIGVNKQLKPILGALLVGALGILLPRVMGNGYDSIQDCLSGKIIWGAMAVLILAKIAATSITLGSGGAGGVFAPALFIGAMLGGSYGRLAGLALPGISPGAYATVGIGAFLAAATHAPMTGIFLIFEMTGDYRLIIPLMTAAIIATLVSKRLEANSIDTYELRQRGVRIHMGKEAAIMNSIRAGDVMRTRFLSFPENTPAGELMATMVRNNTWDVPLTGPGGRMTGIISLKDLTDLVFDEELKGSTKARDVATRDIIMALPDEDLNRIIEKFSLKDLGSIPVVDPADPGRVLGMLSRRDVLAAYEKQVLKRIEPV